VIAEFAATSAGRALAAGILTLIVTGATTAAEPKTDLLWPNGAPGAKGDADGDKPSITIYRPDKEKANGAAIVVCPGGGYGHLAMGHEGQQIAQWLVSGGITALVLKYRHRGVGYGHPAPLDDAQRAMRIARAKAKDLGIDPQRIGIMGFSAGGHLASSAGTHFDAGDKDAADPIQRESCRPDFQILVYPVISLSESFAHAGSRRNLLGEAPDRKLVDEFSNEKHVTKDTPPAFLVHTKADRVVPAANSEAFYRACLAAKVPAQLQLFENGPHGFGLGKGIDQTETWPERCLAWLGKQGFLSPAK